MRLMMWCVRFEKSLSLSCAVKNSAENDDVEARDIERGVAVGGGVYVRNVKRSEERCEINEIKIAVGYENKYIHILKEILCSRFIFSPLSLCSSLHHSFASSSSFSSSSHRRSADAADVLWWCEIYKENYIIITTRQHSTSHRCTTATNDASDRHGSSSNGSLIWIFDYH